MKPFDGKVALVAAGMRGIGAATVNLLLEGGAKVSVCGVSESPQFDLPKNVFSVNL